MSKRNKNRFSKLAMLAQHTDPDIALENVERHGYRVGVHPDRFLTRERWYYIIGPLVVTDDVVKTVGLPAQYKRSMPDGTRIFAITGNTLAMLGVTSDGRKDVLVVHPHDAVYIFKFKQAGELPVVDQKEVELRADVEAAQARARETARLEDDALRALDAAALARVKANKEYRVKKDYYDYYLSTKEL